MHSSSLNFKFLANNIPQIVWTALPDGSVDYLNDSYYNYTGVKKGMGIGWSWESLVHPEDREQLVKGWKSAVELRESFTNEFRLLRHDGIYRWYLSQVVPQFNDDGIVMKWLGTCTDIEEGKNTRNKVEKELHFLESLTDSLPVVLYLYDLEEDKVIYGNKMGLEFTGICKEETSTPLKYLAIEYVHPDDIEKMYERRKQFKELKDGELSEVEFRIKDQRGSWRWVQSFGTVFKRNEKGEVLQVIQTLSDRTVHKQMEERLSQYQNLLLKSNEVAGLASYDRDLIKNTTIFNNEVRVIYEIPESIELTLDFLETMIEPESRERRREMFEVALAERRSGFSLEYKIITYETKTVKDLWAKVKILYDDNGPVRIIGTSLDITEKNKIVKELRESRDQAVAANIQKNRFLANISHEIRTPLNAILGFSDLLLSNSYSIEEKNIFISDIKSSGNLLSKLIEDIIDISKIEEGKLTLVNEEFWVQRSILEFCSSFKFTANEKGLSFLINISPDLPDVLIGDKGRINQIVGNIISNAIKFTKAGEIIVNIGGHYTDKSKSKFKLKVSVADSGIGIPLHFQLHVFDKFFQCDNTIQRNYTGAGLGLAIVKSLVQQMGGDIFLVSPIDEKNLNGPGSMFGFYVELPVAEMKLAKEVLLDSAKHKFDNELKILVAEDNLMNQKLMSLLLKEMGCQVIIANNGMEAIVLMKKENPDLILMDIQMPIMDGYKATAYIRKEMKSTIPIIGVSADVFEEALINCIEVGMDGHVGKPVKDGQLFQVITRVMNKIKLNASE